MKNFFRIRTLFFLPVIWLQGWQGEGHGQTNTNRPEFLKTATLQARVGQDFRHQILIGGKGRTWVGADDFSDPRQSKGWKAVQRSNGRLTNSDGQLALVASASTSASNPASDTLQWVHSLPLTNSWLAYMEVVVSNSLPISGDQYAAAGMGLFQSNRHAGSLVFTNASDAALLRQTTSTNRALSAFVLNNLPFTGTFASNTASLYRRQAGSPRAALVFTNLGGSTNTLSYQSTTNSSLTNSNNTILGSPNPATAVAAPTLLLPSGTNWTVTLKVHYEGAFVAGSSYLGAAIVKNAGTNLLTMFTNRVILGLQYNTGSQRVASDAFASGSNVASGFNPPLSGLDPLPLRYVYDAETTTLSCAFDNPYDDPDVGWITSDTFNLANSTGNLGRLWNFNPGQDSFRLLLTADTGVAGGNANGANFRMYFTDLEVTTEPVDDDTPPKEGSTVWLGLLYDATSTNLVQQFSPGDGDYTDLTTQSGTAVNLGGWGTNTKTSPLHLRIGAEAGQTNLPSGAVAIRSFALIPPPGEIEYSSTNLPEGLTLDPDYGVIEGIPTSGGTKSFSVVARNPFGGLSSTQVFQMVIRPATPMLGVTTNGELRYGVTNTNAFVVIPTNAPAFGTNPLTFSASGLPAGVFLRSSPGATQAVFGGAPLSLVGTNRTVVFSASNSQAGVGRFTSVISVFPGRPGLALTQVAALPRYQTSGVSTSQPFWILTNGAAGQDPAAFPAQFSALSGFPTSALALNASNGQILARSNRITNSGIFSVVFAVTNAGGSNQITNTLTINPSAPVVTRAASPVFPSNGIAFGAASTNFFQFAVQTNTPGYSPDFSNTFALFGAPSGISIHPSTGVVSGTNTTAGLFSLQVSVENTGGFDTTNFTLTCKPTNPLFRAATNRAQYGVPNTNALVFSLTNPSSQLATNDFPVTWSAPSLPDSFTSAVVGTNFVIRSANPTVIGTFSNITVVASNLGGATTNSNIGLTVLPAVPAFSVTSNNTPFQVDKPATNAIAITVTNTAGQDTNFPISFSASNLPTSWSLVTNSTNRFMALIESVNPTQAVNLTNLVLRVGNAGGTNTNTLTLQVLPPQPVFVITTNRTMQFGTNSTNAVTFRVLADGQNTNEFPVGLFASNLPPGLSLTTNTTNRLIGIIGGTNPLAAGVFTNVVLGATNAGGTYTNRVTLRVLPALPRISVTTNRMQFGSNSPAALVVTVTNTSGQDLTNFPLGFSLSNAPGGLAFTNTNGLVATAGSTNPTVATNQATFSVIVTNLAGAVTNTLTNFVILPALPALLAETNGTFQYALPADSNAVVVSVTNTNGQNTNAGQFPVTFSVSNVPSGVTATTNATNRLILNLAGTPGVAGIFSNVTVYASNAAGTGSNTLTLRLLPAAPELVAVDSTNLLQVGVSNDNVISFKVANSAGQNYASFPITYSFNTTLPAGLSAWTNTGSDLYTLTITGTPTVAGTFSSLSVTASNAGGSTNLPFSLTVLKATPVIGWTNPVAITYGTALSTNQLNATSSVAGTFTYNPTNGTILNAGTNTLQAVFNATDTANYVSPTTNTVSLVVNKATPSITWTNPAAVTYGTPLSSTQLNATSSVAGSFAYNPTNGAIVNAGTNTLNVTLTPTDTTNYTTASNSVSLVVGKATPSITWTNPAAITYGTPLSTNQLNATSSVTGTFTYNPTNGAIVNAGTNTLQAVFNATDTTNNVSPLTNTVTLVVDMATPSITWSNPAAITYGTPLSSTQLNATSPVAGTFTYNPTSGAIVNAGTNTLQAIFNATDTTNYVSPTTNTVSLVVNKATPSITWTNPAAITYGTPLSSTQLNATSSVAGSFAYNPTNGAIVNAGTNNILQAVFDADDTTNYVSPRTNTVTLVVDKASNTITFAALPTNKVYGEDPPFGLSASASSGLTVEFESLNTNVATLSGTNLTMQSAGTAPIVASQAGDSNYVAAASVTNPITILPGKPELDGPSSLTLTNLSTNAYFRYQVSARGAGQFWAGRSDFTNALTISWNTNGSSNSGASVSTNSGALRYVWNTTNSNSAHVTWKKALPLDSDWQVSVKVNFANDTNVTDLSGLNFADADQYVENGLFAFKDSNASMDDYSLAFFRGNSNQPGGYVDGSGATNGTEGYGAVATNAAGGLAYLGLAYSASNNQLISLGNPNVTNNAWVNLFTNNVSPWTNAAYTNSLVLRLRGESYAPTNTNYSAEFSDFVIVPLGNLTYSATNLPNGLEIDPNTGLISGQPTASGTNPAEVVISNPYGTVTNTIEFVVP